MALSPVEHAPEDQERYFNIEATNPYEWVVHAATSSIELGDDELDTEVSNNADLSLRWSQTDDFVRLTAYYTDFTDYINLVNTGLEQDEVTVCAYVQDDAEFYVVHWLAPKIVIRPQLALTTIVQTPAGKYLATAMPVCIKYDTAQ